jgi:hypothetical protein
MGTNAVLDRLQQTEPKVLIACDGVTYGGCDFDRMAVVQELRQALPTLQHILPHNNLGTSDAPQHATNSIAACARFSSATARNDAETAAFEPRWLPFDHRLWIVYSSGTTGLLGADQKLIRCADLQVTRLILRMAIVSNLLQENQVITQCSVAAMLNVQFGIGAHTLRRKVQAVRLLPSF